MSPPRRTMPGGIPVQQQLYTPTPVVVENPAPRPAVGSRVFVMILSTILGIVVATTGIIGFTGKYFFVDRAEYAERAVLDAKESGKLQGLIGKLEATVIQLTSSVERLDTTVRALELRQASGRR